jgi:hypothetical protein
MRFKVIRHLLTIFGLIFAILVSFLRVRGRESWREDIRIITKAIALWGFDRKYIGIKKRIELSIEIDCLVSFSLYSRPRSKVIAII